MKNQLNCSCVNKIWKESKNPRTNRFAEIKQSLDQQPRRHFYPFSGSRNWERNIVCRVPQDGRKVGACGSLWSSANFVHAVFRLKIVRRVWCYGEITEASLPDGFHWTFPLLLDTRLVYYSSYLLFKPIVYWNKYFCKLKIMKIHISIIYYETLSSTFRTCNETSQLIKMKNDFKINNLEKTHNVQ